MTDRDNHFLDGGQGYARHRPTYPTALVDALADECSHAGHALDVGCGSGQLSVLLASRFEAVTATDPSADQLASALAHPRVAYAREPAERIGLAGASVDMLVTAQAAHWFDLPAFYAEARRVVRPGGVLALVSYGVPEVDGEVGHRLDRFYWEEIHPYWPPGRRHVEEGYRTLAFPFAERGLDPSLAIVREWSVDDLLGYVATWSATRRAGGAGDGRLFDALATDLHGIVAGGATTTIRWPITARVTTLGEA